MSRGVKTTLILSAIFVSLAWTIFAWRRQATGGSANNGLTGQFRGPRRGERPERPQIGEAQREQMRAARESGDFEKMREIMQANIPRELRPQMEDRRRQMEQRRAERNEKALSILGPEQFQQLQESRRGRRGRGGFGRGGPGGPRGGGGRGGRG